MATSALESAITCGICLEKYNSLSKVPKILPCQHTFCESCIQAVMADNLMLKCPVCRNVTSASKLVTNLAIKNLVEDTIDTSCNPIMCEVHKGQKGLMICTDCLEVLCKSCIKEISIGKHLDHNLESPGDSIGVLKEQYERKLDERIKHLSSDELTNAQVEKEFTMITRNLDFILGQLEIYKDAYLRAQKLEREIAIKEESFQLRESVKYERKELNNSNYSLKDLISKLKSLAIYDLKKIDDPFVDKVDSTKDNILSAVKRILGDQDSAAGDSKFFPREDSLFANILEFGDFNPFDSGADSRSSSRPLRLKNRTDD